MKLSVKYTNNSLLIVLLAVTIGVSGLSVQQAWAMPGPDIGLSTGTITQGGSIEITVRAQEGNSFEPTHRGTLYIVQHTVPVTVALHSNGVPAATPPCSVTPVSADGTPGAIWELQDKDGNPVTYTLTTFNANPDLRSRVTVDFPGNPNPQGANGGSVDGTGPYQWVDITPLPHIAEAANTDTTGANYQAFTCGREADENGNENARGFNDGITFEVVKPVAGEILPIDTTALVLAGLQSSAIWALPTLAVVAGASFGVLYYQIKRR